ncbi:folate-binding protein YgfZ [Microbacterium sp. SORGH_AS_0344]|uniref:CAF17-like 4Fe-4S cluster assembly/insertion protein YgfZ n=1 Tax=Microbacterium sp. SORGH_AS_0344 TaxID=3041767 RepID=UPI0027891854|nr:glycine cleavage T C-terminal barrel domain-containing protein [Microbacterium sp. SORGH_AS_0344]MDQ1084654.1 folate-binding protein YgfZ [Microbacterium sp. SORGH_AS_0344]
MVSLSEVPGAVVDERGLRHVGSPVAEQRRLASGSALAPLGDRRVISVAGEDRRSWLDSLSSQALTHLPAGVSTELLILDPQGRVEHAAAVIDDGETTWLLVDASDAEALASWLTRMRFRLRVEVRDRSDDLFVVGGTRAAVGQLRTVAPVWVDPWPEVSPGGWAYARTEPHPGAERDWAEAIVDAAEFERLIGAAARGESALAGLDAVEALRVAAWRPRVGVDADERLLPHEMDWLRTAVHLSKGCYRGQETVAKVHNLGHPPRRVVALQLDGSDNVLPARGDAVRAGDSVIGAITSVAVHHEEGPIALALVKRTAPEGVPLVVDTADGPLAAAAETVVPADAGATAAVPRLPRLGRRRATE